MAGAPRVILEYSVALRSRGGSCGSVYSVLAFSAAVVDFNSGSVDIAMAIDETKPSAIRM